MIANIIGGLVNGNDFDKFMKAQIQEIDKHKWIESEKLGYDLGEQACFDWIKNYAAGFRDYWQTKKNTGGLGVIDSVILSSEEQQSKAIWMSYDGSQVINYYQVGNCFRSGHLDFIVVRASGEIEQYNYEKSFFKKNDDDQVLYTIIANIYLANDAISENEDFILAEFLDSIEGKLILLGNVFDLRELAGFKTWNHKLQAIRRQYPVSAAILDEAELKLTGDVDAVLEQESNFEWQSYSILTVKDKNILLANQGHIISGDIPEKLRKVMLIANDIFKIKN